MDPQSLRHLGIDANNETWSYFQKPELTNDERDDMLTAAYASHYLWQKSGLGTDIHRARGHWMISRAMCVAGNGPLAEHHAFQCMEFTRKAADAEDFDHVYAIEAEGRAAALNGHAMRARELRTKALVMAEQLADAESRELAIADVKSEPWFGL